LRPVLLAFQLLLQVIADRFAFAVRIGCEVYGIDALRGGFELRDELFLTFDDLIVGREVSIHRHRQILLGQIFNMTEGSLYDVLLAKVLTDGFRLRGGFYDDERVCHFSPYSLSARRTRRASANSPHFNKVLARELSYQSEHLQFKQSSNDL